VADRYVVEGKLGAGGMGVVYRAKQKGLGRPVALKVLIEHVAQDPTAAQRFEKEAQAVARINHPNIVTVYEFGRTSDGMLFLAMELLDGDNLRQIIKRGALAFEDTLPIIIGASRALAEAHAAGIVHRDLKPDNIMVVESRGERTVKVLDFGLAKMVGPENAGPALTSKSIIMGTPGYMAPEQIHGKPVDARTDVYALGMVWWEMLAGRAPFVSDNPIATLMMHSKDPLPTPSSARPGCGVTPRGEALILRMGAKDPRERPLDGAAVVGELRSMSEDSWEATSSVGELAGADDEWAAAFDGLGGGPAPAAAPDATDATVPTEAMAALDAPRGSGTQQLAVLASPPNLTPTPPTGPAADFFGGLDEEVPPEPKTESIPAVALDATVEDSPAAVEPTIGVHAAAVTTVDAPPEPEPEPPRSPRRSGEYVQIGGAAADRLTPSEPADAPAAPQAAPPPPASIGPDPIRPDRSFAEQHFDLPKPAPVSSTPQNFGPPQAAAAPTNIELGRDSRTGPTASGPMEVVGAPIRPDVHWRLRIAGEVQGPYTFEALIARMRLGNIRGSDEAAPVGEPFRPVSSYPLLARELQAKRGTPMTSAPRGATARSGVRRVLFAGLLAIAGLAGAIYGWVPELVDEQLEQLTSGLATAAGAPVPNPIEPYLEPWRTGLGQPGGKADEYLARADELLSDETHLGMHKAEEAVRRALLADPDDPRALGALCELRAQLPPGELSDDLSLAATLAYAKQLAAGASSPRVLRASGVVALKADEVGDALVAFNAADQQAPNDAVTLTWLARASLKQPQRARGHAKRALELQPRSTRARAALGMAQRRLGDFSDAAANLEARVAVEGRDAAAARELALTYLDQGLLRKGTRRLETAWKAQRDVDTALLLGAVLRDARGGSKRVDPILAEASKIAPRHPRGADVLALRAELLLASGKHQQALPLVEEAVQRFSGSSRLLVARAGVLARGGRQPDARGVLLAAEKAVATPADAIMVALAQGDLESSTSRQAALTAYEKAMAVDRRRASPRVARALLQLEGGDVDAARAELFALTKIDPLAQQQRPFDSGWREDWQAWASRAKPLAGKSLEGTLLRGVIAHHAGDRRAAKQSLAQVLRKDKGNPVALLYLAAVELEAGDDARAFSRLQRLDALEPDNEEVQRYLALAEVRAGRLDEASARSGRLLEDVSTLAERATLLGALERKKGNLEKARYHLQRALRADTRYAPPRRALAELPQVLRP
jgi:tetratricopeptide (TPR) repeat protein/predicted Ser/Thr protein kinase